MGKDLGEFLKRYVAEETMSLGQERLQYLKFEMHLDPTSL